MNSRGLTRLVKKYPEMGGSVTQGALWAKAREALFQLEPVFSMKNERFIDSVQPISFFIHEDTTRWHTPTVRRFFTFYLFKPPGKSPCSGRSNVSPSHHMPIVHTKQRYDRILNAENKGKGRALNNT